ncbi:hypothetical protein [Ruegeria profundi]|uniref:hypothetical protein n=1 Tax=Ruegeria profundi TaxID=1685378 RepID=UPI001CD41090|nr:hypothetical protein [Ruegeria profundi]MCA0930686.1 hypothetical protein [Ruegeria profundi]
MHTDLATRRRALLRAYISYLEAERRWETALENARLWYPATNRSRVSFVGNPGSPVRRLHDQRQRALERLKASRLKLAVAKRRLSQKPAKPRTVLRLTHMVLELV